MGHGVSWLNFLPGYQQIQAYLSQNYEGLVFGNAVVLQHVAAAILVCIVVFLVGLKARADLKRAGDQAVIPRDEISVRNILEIVFDALYGQMQSIIGHETKRYFPVIATLTLFIFFSNVLGLIPGFLPPTDNWNTTMSCGLFVFLYYNFHGLRVNGFAHISHLANPVGEWWGWFLAPLFFPIELVSHVARPFSLGVRLASNMIGDHAVLAAFLGLVPVLVPIPFLALGLMVSIVQTLVFVLLSMIYIGMAVEEAHHEEEAHHHGATGEAQPA